MNEITEIVHSIHRVMVNNFDSEVSCKVSGLARDVDDEVQAIKAGIEALNHLNAGSPIGSEFEWAFADPRRKEPLRRVK